MAKKLIVLAGPDEGRSFVLGSEVVMLGRSRATGAPLTDPHTAHIHCQVVPEGNGFTVVDYDSVSGTFVNGKEISRHPLLPGDLIRIGGTHLQFIDDFGATVSVPEKPAAPAAAAVTMKSVEWTSPLVGQTFGNYHISAPLTQGKSGYTFHARDTRTDSAVILKVLKPEFGQDDKKVSFFVKAMKAVLPLSHPHLLKVFGAGKTGTYCWVAMEYSRSDSLAAMIARIEKTGRIDWRTGLRVAINLARALEYAHAKTLIHKNVTPQNILVGKQPENTKLADLMLAHATEEDPTKPISQAGAPSHSLAFMSPERTDGHDAVVDARTDIYSLAATLFAMLTGKPPFVGASVAELIEKIRLDGAPRLQSLNLPVPDEVDQLVRRCLAKRAQDRFPTAVELRMELEKIALANSIPL